MARVVLVGLPLVGKTTLANALARRWNCEAIDTDALIVERAGLSVATLFETEGEASFRQRECQALQDALATDAVVATGGGIVTSAAARDFLRQAPTVWLDADDAALLQRLSSDERPLLRDDPRGAIALLRAAREAHYAEVAGLCIDATLDLDEQCGLITDWLQSA